MISVALEDQGYSLVKATNGREAIEKARSEFPELILLDLNLPDASGKEVLKKIKEADEDIAVIMITGYGGEQIAIDLMKAGAIDFLSKPFNFEDLLNSINNAFKISDAQTEDKKHERYPHLEKFFPFLAHEIRNPLHAISGALAIIQRRSDLQDEVLGQSVRVIQEEVQHLNEFVQECLDFVRPPSESRFVEIDINEVISFIVNTMAHRFEELSQKVKVTAELASEIPKFFGNYEEIKQALLNIVRNGLEAMDGSGEFIIRTAYQSEPKPGWVRITLVDRLVGVNTMVVVLVAVMLLLHVPGATAVDIEALGMCPLQRLKRSGGVCAIP